MRLRIDNDQNAGHDQPAIMIRRAEPGDAALLSDLARVAKASWGYPREWMERWADDLVIDSRYIGHHRVFVAEVDSTINGVTALEDHRTHWQIEHVWIAPHRQGGGIGRRLVEHTRSVAMSIRRMPIRIVSDPFAANFYQRLGAKHVGEIAAPMPGASARTLPLLEFPADE